MTDLVGAELVTAVEAATTGTLFIAGEVMLAAVVSATVAVVGTLAVTTEVGVVFGAMGHPLGKRVTVTPE